MEVDVTKKDKVNVFVDEPLESINGDVFGHKHYVEVIKDLITNSHNKNLNVGLFGKWGVGKTTIINLLKNQFEMDKSFKTVMFECWKYSNEPISLKRKFLIEVAKQTGESTNELMESLYIKGNRQISKQSMLSCDVKLWDSVKQLMKEFVKTLGIILVIELFTFIFLYKLLGVEGNLSLSLVFNTVVLAILYYAVKILKDYTTNVTITKSNENLESLEQFEKAFTNLINKFVKDKNKIVVFVDDLDRCQSKKVIEILETIKTFMNLKNCIFIIACDDDILKRALIEEKIDDTDYLDKIFQIKIAIPPFRQEKIKKYAAELLSSVNTDIPEVQIKDIIDVLIYKNVISPRKVKILLNNFILLYTIFKERQNEGDFICSSFKLNLEFLAKITVLQTEFISTYYALEKYNRLLEYIERVRKGENNYEDSQINILKEYYDFSENTEVGFVVKEEYKDAIEYLYYTSDYTVSREHIKTYIYLSQDTLNTTYSDDYVEKLEDQIITKDVKGFVNEISKTKSSDERIEIFNNLLMRIEKYENLDLVNILSSVTNPLIVQTVPNEIINKFSSVILSKIQQFKDKIKLFDISGVMAYINATERYESYPDVINKYIDNLTLENIEYSINVLKSICINDKLSFDIAPLYRYLIKLYGENHESVLNLINIINNNKALIKYFSGDVFVTIMDYNEQYSDEDKEIIAEYLRNISDYMIINEHSLLTEKLLKYINDENNNLSYSCIEVLDVIIKTDKDLSIYVLNIIDALSQELSLWNNEDIYNIILELIIKLGNRYEISNENKAKLVGKLCEIYLKDEESYIKCYIIVVNEVIENYDNIDIVVQNIIQVISSLKSTNNSSKHIVSYIMNVKDYIDSTHKTAIVQKIIDILGVPTYMGNINIVEYLFNLLIQCQFIIEPAQLSKLSDTLISMINSKNEEIVKLTFETYVKLTDLFSNNDIRNKYFNSILNKMENNLIIDFAVEKFIQNYPQLTDTSIAQRIMSIIIKKNSDEKSNNPTTVIEILDFYGSETILVLLEPVFVFINKKFNIKNKIINLCKLISKTQFKNKDIELKILVSMHLVFDEEVKRNVLRNLLFNEFDVRQNTIQLFLDAKLNDDYTYILNLISEKIESVDERKNYYFIIEDKIKNSSSEVEIGRLLQLFINLKDNNDYLSRNKANDIINNTFIFLLEGGLIHKKAALNTLMQYYCDNKYPRMIGSKFAMLLNNIIMNDKELKEKAIIIANESGLYKKNNELKNNIAGSTAAITGE